MSALRKPSAAITSSITITPAETRHVVEVMPYQARFADRFAEGADKLWEQLIDLVPVDITVDVDGRQIETPEQLDRAVYRLDRHIFTWADRYGLAADWLIEMATRTVLVAMVARMTGEPLPTTLCAREYPLWRERADTPVRYEFSTRLYGPPVVNGDIPIQVQMPVPVWDRVNVARGTFINQTVEEYKRRLIAHLDRLQPAPVPFARDNPRLQWVDWTIAAHSGEWTINRLAEDVGKTRKGVRQAVQQMDEILGFRQAWPRP